MNDTQRVDRTATFEIEHIGGIDTTTVELTPGVTVLAGRNATNRTSFLQAIMAVMGSDQASLKADADEGTVQLTIGADTYQRRLSRRNGHIQLEGEPYLEDPTTAELFAFLLESNDCRRAIVREDNLRELIMRPVDTEAIAREIDELERERADIDKQLAELSDLDDRLPELAAERQALTDQIEDKRELLADRRAQLNAANRDIQALRADNEELDTALEELEDARSQYERLERNIETERESITALKADKAEYEAELEELTGADQDSITDIEHELSQLRERVDHLERTTADLQSLIQFNEDVLAGNADLLEELRAEPDDPTDRLLGDSVTCWTCGSTVSPEQIESALDSLRSLREKKMTMRESLEEDIDDLESRKRTLESQRDQRQRLERSLSETERELRERRTTLDSLIEQRDELETTIASLEAEVETLQADVDEAVLDLQETVNRLEFEIESLERDRAEIEDEIETIEAELDRRSRLEAQREELTDALTERRTHIERLESEAVEAFNTHMAEVLDILGYENIERVWIERTQRSVQQGRQVVNESAFELHIVRSMDDGTVYEDTVTHLSESEREVIGLVFALAGYLVHEVYETVPIMLLDSLEAIDADRLAGVIEYFSEYAEYLIVALLVEDADALPTEIVDTRITDI